MPLLDPAIGETLESLDGALVAAVALFIVDRGFRALKARDKQRHERQMARDKALIERMGPPG